MELQKYKDIEFYTCHCTGEKAYHYLSQQMDNINDMSCGNVRSVYKELHADRETGC